jgi:hypothetical protein
MKLSKDKVKLHLGARKTFMQNLLTKNKIKITLTCIPQKDTPWRCRVFSCTNSYLLWHDLTSARPIFLAPMHIWILLLGNQSDDRSCQILRSALLLDWSRGSLCFSNNSWSHHKDNLLFISPGTNMDYYNVFTDKVHTWPKLKNACT